MSNSKVTKVEAELRRVEMFVPFKVAYGATTVAELTIVQITDQEGRVGIGEGAPPSYLSTEEKLRATKVAEDIAKECLKLSTDDALKILDKCKWDIFAEDPIAFVAVETALWDLRGQQRGRSICDEFGGPKRKSVMTDITLPLLDVKEVEGFWKIMGSHGFRTLKVKVSGNISEDMDRIQELLRVTPKGMEIFLDGNQGFTTDKCVELLDALKKAGAPTPLFFEQPLPKDAWDDLKALRGKIEVPVCLDETVSSINDIKRCIRDKVAPMVNLKMMKSGISETFEIAKLAAAAKMPMMIGGMVESEITMTLSLHLMCAMNEIQYADLDTPFFLRERLCEKSAWHEDKAKLEYLGGPGLGLKLKSSVG